MKRRGLLIIGLSGALAIGLGLIALLRSFRLPDFPLLQAGEAATGTSTPDPSQIPCIFNWATQALPDLSMQVQSAMEEAGLTGISPRAEAYGENCYSMMNQPIYFAVMETDFRIRVDVASLTDTKLLGDMLEKILIVLDGFPTESTPGPNPGYVGVTFQNGGEELRLWFPIGDGEAARAEGLSGSALLERLQNR